MNAEILGMGRATKKEAEQTKKKIINLYQAGPISLEEIGAAVGVTRAYVSLVLREAGINANDDREAISSELEQIRTLSGLNLTKLADMLDIRREMLSRWSAGHVTPDPKHVRRIRLLLSALERAKSSSP